MTAPNAPGEGTTNAPTARARDGWSVKQEVAAYLATAIVYVTLGFVAKGVFAWWLFGAAFLIAAVWGVPAIWRRLG